MNLRLTVSGWHKRFAKFKNQNSKIKNRFERRFFYDNIDLESDDSEQNCAYGN